MNWIDWAIVGLYVASAIGIGAWFTRKASQGTADFFVAGRVLLAEIIFHEHACRREARVLFFVPRVQAEPI